MKRHPFAIYVCLLISILGFSCAVTASEESLKDAAEVILKRPQLALMASYLIAADELQLKRQFASITLRALREAYSNELKRLNVNGANTNSKLDRWQRATADYIARIDEIHSLVNAGRGFNIWVTREDWVLIAVENKQALVSGPSGSDIPLESTVINEFCQLYDCQWLTQFSITEDEATTKRPGTWVFQQKNKPVFNVAAQFQFSFKNTQQKIDKQQLAYAVVTEIKRLLSDLRRAERQGYTINWQQLLQQVSTAGIDQRVMLNTGELYLRVPLYLVTHLHPDDWQRLLKWLKLSLNKQGVLLFIEHADEILAVEHTGMKDSEPLGP